MNEELRNKLIAKLKDSRDKLIEVCEADIIFEKDSKVYDRLIKCIDEIEEVNRLVDEIYSYWF